MVVYARADNTFAVWDRARNHATARTNGPDAYRFDAHQLWYGLDWGEKRICNGLIQDWVTWQLEASAGRNASFAVLSGILGLLSHPEESMTPTEPERLFVDDSRKYPVVELPYGKIPVIFASAGMQRILGLSYLIAWSWMEHVEACRLLGWSAPKKLVFLLDEPESHLHPKWQRHLTPALLKVFEYMGSGVAPQVLMTTHSPLVLASIEPRFKEDDDRLFLFELQERKVSLRNLPWFKGGDAIGWLTSHVFGLGQARSIEAERAIEAAYAHMRGDLAAVPDYLKTAEAMHRELTRVLPDQDPFLIDWYGWHKHGIRIDDSR